MSTNHNPETRPKKSSKNKALLWVGLPVLLLASCGMGAAMGASGEVEPEPAPTVTVSAEPEPAPTVTVTAEPVVEEVEVTPQRCLEALALADQGFTLAGESMGVMVEAINAASEFNVAGIEQATGDLGDLTTELNDVAGPYNAAKAACRASAE